MIADNNAHMKNLDEYDYGTSKAEKRAHLAIMILKHKQRVNILQGAFEQ